MRKILFLLFIMCCATGAEAQTRFRQIGETERQALIPERSKKNGITKEAIRLYKQNRKQMINSVKRVKNTNIPADKAEIILEAHDVWGYGVGYQMLLDENHNTYGDLFDNTSYEYMGYSYDEFEYKIPNDAEADKETKTVIVDGEGKVQIPSGTYDYMITCPFPGDAIVFAKGQFACFDDFQFEGGYTYHFLITLNIGDIGMEDVAILYADTDASITELVLPANGMDLTNAETISVKIANRGVSAISGFPVCYQVNEGNVVTETYTGTIEPQDTVDYVFKAKADFSAEQMYTVKAYTKLPGDLVPYNDSKVARCRHVGASSLPYSYDFSSKENFPFDWTIINANEDFIQWEYGEWETHSGDMMGYVYCGSYGDGNDDYLLSSPIRLESGDNYITFYVKVASSEMPELLDVRYGSTVDVTTMNVIGDYTLKDEEWILKAINFSVAESGVYYFAFHSRTAGGASLSLDDILIDRGVYETSPNLTIEKILLPYSNCDLSDQSPVGVRLTNKGTGAATSITLTYTVNDGTPVKQTFAETLEPDASKDFYFDTPADFLDLGKYEVTVKAETGKNADEQTDFVEHYAPITEFPAVTDFYQNAGIEGNWTLMSEEAWSYEYMGSCYSCKKGGIENGLLSRCFTFNRPFRVKVAYTGGRFDTSAGFYIAYGRPGTDISGWTKIYEDKNILGDVEKEFSVDLKEFGNYSIAIVDISEDPTVLTSLYQITISEIYEHDARITGVISPLAPYMPVNHINKEGTYTVNVENRGSGKLTNVKASVGKGTEKLFASEAIPSLNASTTGVLSIYGKLPALSIGGTTDLNVKVEMAEVDSYLEDNTWTLPTVHATDTVFATEQTEEFIYGTGLTGQTAYFGNIYTLSERDTLTSVTVGMAQDNYYMPVDMGVAVYSLKADGVTIDRELFSKTFERGGEGGLRQIAFTPRILDPGKYYFEVRQLSYNNIGLTYEIAENSTFYQNVDGTLYEMPGYGNIVVRANFGHNSQAYRKNVAVMEITKPKKTAALFSSVETVEAIIENSGCEAASGIIVHCIVGDIDKTLTLDLAPYEKKAVTFEGIDLSKPGNYTLTVSAILVGDENPNDDAVTRELTSEEEANPYILDFESCDDFDTGHEFNPRWWTVDRLGVETDAWWQFDYPHSEEPVGFIAFNIEKTVPAMTDELNVPGFFPHTGKRFGAAFAPGYISQDNERYVSDTWLISPKLKLNGHSSLELYVKTHALESREAQLERYKLYISDTDDKFDSFRLLGEERQAPVDWTKVTVDLNAYNNKEVYIALQYVSVMLEGVVMMVDDIRVKSDGVGIDHVENTEDIQLSVTEDMLTFTSAAQIRDIRLYDISGQQIYQSGRLTTDYYRLSLAPYPQGVYMACVQTAAGEKTMKFVVTK